MYSAMKNITITSKIPTDGDASKPIDLMTNKQEAEFAASLFTNFNSMFTETKKLGNGKAYTTTQFSKLSIR